MRIGRERARGFTLVEVLIALSLVTGLLLLLLNGLYAGTRTWTHSSTASEQTDRRQAACGFLRRTLEGTVPLIFQGAEGNRLAFVGLTDGLHWIGTLPPAGGLAGYYALSLALRNDAGGAPTLILQYRPVLTDVDFPADKNDADTRTAPLLTGISDLRFSYFGARSGEQAPQWSDSWNDVQKLPMLVRIAIRHGDSAAVSLIIPLRTPTLNNQPQWVVFAP